MKCLKCDHDNAADAKFCGVCGAAMPASTPLAATQPMSPPIPASTGSPRSTAKFIVLGAVVLVLAAVGFLVYKMFGGGGMLPTPAMEARKPPAAEAQKDESPAAPQQDARPASQGASTSPPAAEPAKTPERPTATEPVTPAPGAAPKAPASKAAPAPAQRPVPSAKAAPKSSGQAASVEAARPDRWAMMAAEMEACKREPFLTRVVCEQKVGQNYCAGYWGLVPQCGGQAKQ